MFSGVVYLENWAFIVVILVSGYQAFKNNPASQFDPELEDDEENNPLV